MNNSSIDEDYPFNSQIPQDSINIYEIQNNIRDLSYIEQDQFIFKDEDYDITLEKDEEYIKKKNEECIEKKDKEYINEKKGEECIEKKDEEYINEIKNEFNDIKEDNIENNQSNICDENLFFPPCQNPEIEDILYKHNFLENENPSFEKSEFEENFYEICEKLSKEENMHQTPNQIIYLKQTKILYDQRFPIEKQKEKNNENFSLEDEKIKSKIDIPKKEINSKLSPNHSSYCSIHKAHEFKNDIQQKTGNSSQISINPNISLIHNNSEIKINIPNKLNNSKQIKKDSTINGSTGDSTQKNNINISLINKYKYPFEIIHPKEEDSISKIMKLNMSSENLYSNFKRKRKIIREEIKIYKPFKKSEDLEKSILRKFKGYLRYEKDNKIKEFQEIFDEDRNFWDSFLKNSKPFEFKEGGETKKFNSYSKDLMNFIFKRDDVDDLYEKFISDKSYIKHILENLDNKSEDYKRAYLITLKNLNKKYNGKYKDGDLELGLDEFS
jgi:hypothetical protein